MKDGRKRLSLLKKRISKIMAFDKNKTDLIIQQNRRLLDRLVLQTIDLVSAAQNGDVDSIEKKINERKLLISLIGHKQQELEKNISTFDQTHISNEINTLKIHQNIVIKKILELDQKCEFSIKENLQKITGEQIKLHANKSKVKKFRSFIDKN